MDTTTLPLLLPASVLGKQESDPQEWKPSRYQQAPQPPPTDDSKQHDLEMAAARQLIDGKAFKKVRPRRTVDYFAGVGRWTLLRKISPSPRYLPYMRPAAPYIIDLLPPKAYPENSSTSLCTKFVHTSTNKIRCPVNCVVWTPECRRVLTGSTSGEFTLWNGLTFNFETILQAHETAIRAMRFTHSGAFLASADQSGVIKYFQPNMNNLTAWNGHREAIRALSFSPDDGRFATASDDSTVRIWAFEEQREERVLTGHGWDVKCVEWHPTKGLLVSGSKDNMMKFWDPRTGNCISTLHHHKNTIQALAWSPNGNMVASASRDQTVRVFDIRAMREVQILRGHKKEVCSVTWHPFHPLLVSGGSEGSILHWDLSSSPVPPLSLTQPSSYDASTAFTSAHSPPPRATLSQAHDSNVWALAFHSLGHLLVSASNDHTTRFWCRERPGDAASVFSGGGEKPPEADPNAGDQEDYEDLMVPGFTANGPGESWWEDQMDASGGGSGGGGGLPGMGPPGGRFPQMDSYGSGRDFGGHGGSGGTDDFIPGFGGMGEGSGGGGGYSGGGGGGGGGGGSGRDGAGGYGGGSRKDDDRDRDRDYFGRGDDRGGRGGDYRGGRGGDRQRWGGGGGGGGGGGRRRY